MIKISAIAHATFETPDLARMLDYYQNVLGLTLVARADNSVYLACPRDYHSVVLNAGSTGRCTGMTLRMPGDVDLKDARKFLASHNVAAEIATDSEPSAPNRLAFDGPDGIRIGLIHDRDVPARDPAAKGIGPRKLGHMAFNVHDVQGSVDFFTTVLGFRVSDWMGDFFAFLRCGSDHHTVNLLHGKTNKMHHIAFEANDWEHIRTACDYLGKHKIPLIWGPGRHGIGHNIFIYHQTPDGQIMELYTDLDQMNDEASGAFDPRPWHEDNPQKPKVWQPGPATSNIWGIPTPQMFRE